MVDRTFLRLLDREDLNMGNKCKCGHDFAVHRDNYSAEGTDSFRHGGECNACEGSETPCKYLDIPTTATNLKN